MPKGHVLVDASGVEVCRKHGKGLCPHGNDCRYSHRTGASSRARGDVPKGGGKGGKKKKGEKKKKVSFSVKEAFKYEINKGQLKNQNAKQKKALAVIESDVNEQQKMIGLT